MIEPTGYTALDLIGFTDRGGYDPDAYYVKNDIVTVGNTKWRCLIDDTHNITPTEGANWTIYLESATSLAGMDDVNITMPADGDFLQFNGSDSEWINTHDEISAIENVYGSKNLLQNNMIPTTKQTVTMSVDKDGIITTSGTASATFTHNINSTFDIKRFIGKKLVINGVTGGADATYRVYCNIYDASNNLLTNPSAKDGDTEFTVPNNADHVLIELIVYSGIDMTGKVIKPMICDARIKDRTYVPHAKTNRQLTEDKAENSVIGTVENDATASKAYGVGDHFIRNGKYCIVSAAIAQGATLTENTNYIVSNIIESNYVCRITFNGDCDTLAPGIVYYGNTGSHAPFNWAIIQTFFASASGANRVQIAYRAIDFGMAIRYYGAGTWSAWKTVTLS